MELNIERVEEEGRTVFYVAGEIDAYTAPKMKEALERVTPLKEADIIIDLTDVSYMDSTGLGVFVGFYKSVDAAEGSVKIVGTNRRLHRLFEITGLDEIIDVERIGGGE